MKKITLFLGVLLMSCASLFAQAPANAPDVMLQGFYWDSYKGGSYGNTNWTNLKNQVDEIAESFDLVWLPPSAKSSGGTGYHPKEWSNQNSEWGTKAQLKELIAAFKAKNTRCVADIVINHRDGNYNWTDFCNEDFGTYGKFTLYPGAPFICKNDECTAKGHSATGNYDEGYETLNCDGVSASGAYCASRDLDHKNTTLQAAIKAYLQWMKGEIGYDGWRYDLVKGYKGYYNGIYNDAAKAYMSVGEYWDGNYDAVKNWIKDTGYKSMAFDFPMKYAALNNALAGNNYAGLAGGYGVPHGLCGADEMKRYSVTFVDNHDTFRDHNKYGGDWTKANAYILSAPGIPCVFYPHWKECKKDIQAMIKARKSVGVHSQSKCTTEGTCGSYYKCTTTGTNGTLICFIGGGWQDPAGYTKACSGNGWAFYTKGGIPGPGPGPDDPQPDDPTPDDPTPSQSYAIRVNGTTNYPAEYKGTSSVDPSFEEYMASVQLNEGDTFVTYDLVNKAGWVMEVEPYGEYANFEVGATSVKCKKAGCYDFYIKMKFQADIMYIGPGTNCGDAPKPDDPEPDDPEPDDPQPDDPNPGPTPSLEEGYYIRVNGNEYYKANALGTTDMQGREQFMASVPLKAGDKFQCYDGASGAAWSIVTLEPYGAYANFTAAATYSDEMVCNVDGCYDLYIKLMYEDDTMYIGEGTDCSAEPIKPDPSAIDEAEAVELNIYPNPTNDYINIDCAEEISEVVISALNGSEVIRTKSTYIDLSSLTPSMYFVNVMLQNGDVVVSKVIRK